MMYLALSYDHRIVDGKEAVTFLVRVKECLEDPHRSWAAVIAPFGCRLSQIVEAVKIQFFALRAPAAHSFTRLCRYRA